MFDLFKIISLANYPCFCFLLFKERLLKVCSLNLLLEFSRLSYCSIIKVLCSLAFQRNSLFSLTQLSQLVKHFFYFFLFKFFQKIRRRKRDLNPRAARTTYTLSRGASSASWVFLQMLNLIVVYSVSYFLLRQTHDLVYQKKTTLSTHNFIFFYFFIFLFWLYRLAT